MAVQDAIEAGLAAAHRLQAVLQYPGHRELLDRKRIGDTCAGSNRTYRSSHDRDLPPQDFPAILRLVPVS